MGHDVIPGGGAFRDRVFLGAMGRLVLRADVDTRVLAADRAVCLGQAAFAHAQLGR